MTGSSRRRVALAMVLSATGLLAIGAAQASAASTVTYNPSAFGSSFSVTGEANDDVVTISSDGTTITIADAGTGGISTADADCANVGGAVQCPLDPPDPAPPADPTAPVLSGSVSLLAANDSAASTAPFPVSFSGGTGDDTLTGGPDDDNLDGGNDNDNVFGGDGDDVLNGGGTAFTTGGTDFLDGQGGFDEANYGRFPGVNVSLNNLADDGFAGEGDNVVTERVNGGQGDDVLTGNDERNFLDGNDGNDLLVAAGGSDTVDGDDGNDSLDGGAQRDEFQCDDDFDTGVVDPRDEVEAECERTGAEMVEGTSTVNKKHKLKVTVNCPVEEANNCAGDVELFAGSTSLGSAGFSAAAGGSDKVSIKLNSKGQKRLDKSGGSLLASAQAQTTEPIGTSVKEGHVFLRRKAG